MASDAFGTVFVSAQDDALSRGEEGGRAHPLLSRPGIALPLLLVAAALSAIILASADLWQLGAQVRDTRAQDMDWTFAQAQIEVLRLHEAAENLTETASARAEFKRRHDLLIDRLAQIQAGPARQIAENMGLQDDIAAAGRAIMAHGAGAARMDRQELALLTARLALLDRMLALAGSQANSAYDAMKAERMERLRRTLVLGTPLVMVGLLGLVLLALRILGIERRVLEVRRVELDLQRERDDASYMRNIAAVVSHQMRGPLAVIDSAAQRMLANPELAAQEDAGTAILRIRRQVRRMLHFMDQAMLAGTIESGSWQARVQPVAADDLIAMVMAHDAIQGSRDRLVPPPAGGARLRVLCDPDLAFHALANIVENALKYSPEGSPVELRVTGAGAMAAISVTDHGRGVPAAEREAIFQRFRRGSNALDRPGTGVGLWLARRLAEIQGGTVRVASDGRTGARFDLCLPLAAACSRPLPAAVPGPGGQPAGTVDPEGPAGAHHAPL